jgi:hypothetical protein
MACTYSPPAVHVLGPSVVCVPKLVLLFLMGCKEVKHQLFFFYMQWIGAGFYASKSTLRSCGVVVTDVANWRLNLPT